MGVLGTALWDHHQGYPHRPLVVECDRAPDEEMSQALFFLPMAQMAKLDQLALHQARGQVLDVGAGAGRHSLALQTLGHTPTALEADADCARLCQTRGVGQVEALPWQQYRPGPVYDTALALMNGAGLAATFDALPAYLQWLYGCLAPGGKLLLDTSTVHYLPKPQDPARRPDEVWFRFSYGVTRTEPFSWLFLAPAELQRQLRHHGFRGVRPLYTDTDGRTLIEAKRLV